MPIFNLGKKPEAEQKQVPDELPDLPQGVAANTQQAAAQQSVPAELPPVDLAPDELPPVDVGGTPELAQGEDKRLYFSMMLQKLNEEGVKSTKLTVPTANLLTDMKKHWKQQKKTDEIQAMRQKVAESITPLQRLEQEWVALQEDIEMKKDLLHQKEEEIRKLAEEAKMLALKAERSAAQGK